VIGVDVVGPWRGDAKYDYIMAGNPNATYSSSSTQTSTTSEGTSFPLSMLLIVGGIAVVVGGGVVVYVIFISGGEAAGTSGVGAGSSIGSTANGSAGETSSSDGKPEDSNMPLGTANATAGVSQTISSATAGAQSNVLQNMGVAGGDSELLPGSNGGLQAQGTANAQLTSGTAQGTASAQSSSSIPTGMANAEANLNEALGTPSASYANPSTPKLDQEPTEPEKSSFSEWLTNLWHTIFGGQPEE
jgi:hypothetical protein